MDHAEIYSNFSNKINFVLAKRVFGKIDENKVKDFLPSRQKTLTRKKIMAIVKLFASAGMQ